MEILRFSPPPKKKKKEMRDVERKKNWRKELRYDTSDEMKESISMDAPRQRDKIRRLMQAASLINACNLGRALPRSPNFPRLFRQRRLQTRSPRFLSRLLRHAAGYFEHISITSKHSCTLDLDMPERFTIDD